MKRVAVLLAVLFLASCSKKKFDVYNTQENYAVASRPNIILILLDDVGYEVPTYTGGQSYLTPNMDLIAQQGVQFMRCHSLPLCSPSRVELMTGKYNFRNYTHWGHLDTTNITIANVLKDNGYSTCVVGKWQFDGGDAAIKKLGFDNYSVWLPYKQDNDNGTFEGDGSHYKNPVVYQGADFLPTSYTNGQYGEDIFRQYMFDFIDSNKNKNPFFVYWALNLCHSPFTPTPDDPEFASWTGGNNIKYFPSMVKYMDKELGMLKAKADSIPNTLVIIIGDNGTDERITSIWNNKLIHGGKNKFDEAGTRVPMLFYWKDFFAPKIDSSLVDFSDFFPTLANVAGAPFYPTDGVDFINYDRSWIFQHFQLKGIDSPYFRYTRWVQNKVYKLYDTVTALPVNNKTGNFFRMFDSLGKADKLLLPTTAAEKRNDSIFKSVLAQMHN